MKVSRKEKNFSIKLKGSGDFLFAIDEGTRMFGQLPTSFSIDEFLKPNARRVIATQAFYAPKGGKKIRVLGAAKWEDTGEPIKPAPKKFYPAQVLRRQK